MARSLRLRGAEAWCLFNNSAPDVVVRPRAGRRRRPSSLASLRARGHRRRSCAIRARRDPAASGRARASCAPTICERLYIQDEGSQLVAPLAAAGLVSACSTSAPRPVERRSSWRRISSSRRDVPGPCSSRPTIAPARVRLLAADAAARATSRCPSCGSTRAGRCRSAPVFDAVLLDAPCSGLGTLRRDPDLKWNRTPDQLRELCAPINCGCSQAAADAFGPAAGWSTRPVRASRRRTTSVVDAFLATDGRFRARAHRRAVGAARPTGRRAGCLATLPFRDGLDAFFAAVLVRRKAT